MLSSNFKLAETINQMSIQVKFFASLREKLGQSDMELTAATTAQDAWNQATQNKPVPDNLLVAINLDYAKLDTPLQDGDEVAFFPPVTGG
ncbi:molybdopterin synthase subunit MoaD [Methylophaga sulfidovorans]|uniref:Molybdopterin synthase sulfur carrier subunit n=2 Tax=Methylophaga sulfidovorans TaxID=45496 RepID=A0A1I3U5E7_9GAMM|nr:molybdopterin synthase subunit MoaD [Methylophaga sulfidovorans]